MLKPQDFADLTAAIDRDPARGLDGGSSQSYRPEERKIYDDAHRFFNYQVRKWIERVSQ